ncbi:hypothetical protein ABZV75_38955 [Streptomyces flaveolus]|uniref:hypothetical protein n=1 Tax=Streptomyces flaveolus TaxID=67297 RepID=UPI0033B85920
MADEQYKWLNRETAERLLRGESLEVVDPSVRDQAERLSRALGALSAEAAPAPGELPGEQAALAAFRKVREAAEAERPAAAHAPAATRTPAGGTDAGLVRIGAPARTGIRSRRSRRGRPVRLALAAAVAAGTLGGVAVAAGSGVLPTPFDDEHPRPASSVSPDTTTGQPLASPSAPGDGTGTGAPGGGTHGRSGGNDDEVAGTDDGAGRNAVPGSGAPSATSGTGWLGAPSACRALRDGKDLDAGRKRALERLAGGPGRVTTYCKVLLGAGDSGSGGTGGANSGGSGGNTTGQGSDNGKGEGKDGGDKDGGKDGGKGKGDDGPAGPGGGKGNGKDGGRDNGKGGGRSGGKDGGDKSGGKSGGKVGGPHRGGATPAPSAFAPAHPGASGNGSTTASPTATYTAP